MGSAALVALDPGPASAPLFVRGHVGEGTPLPVRLVARALVVPPMSLTISQRGSFAHHFELSRQATLSVPWTSSARRSGCVTGGVWHRPARRRLSQRCCQRQIRYVQACDPSQNRPLDSRTLVGKVGSTGEPIACWAKELGGE